MFTQLLLVPRFTPQPAWHSPVFSLFTTCKPADCGYHESLQIKNLGIVNNLHFNLEERVLLLLCNLKGKTLITIAQPFVF